MNLIPPQHRPEGIEYPESDGEPMADNTKQARWIVVLFDNLAGLFRHDPTVFVGTNLFWYPAEGHPEIRVAPDVLTVFGRPKGDRPSYLQWLEGDVPLTVAFEVLSPKNTPAEMDRKLIFYEEHGVEEYYVYDPDENYLWVYQRRADMLVRVRPVQGFVSPRLGIRFDLSGPEMVVFGPDGQPFITFEELLEVRKLAESRADQAESRANQAESRADQAESRANQAEQKLARLVELSRKARRGQATSEELAELERLEAESA